jgi:hypothetical protein
MEEEIAKSIKTLMAIYEKERVEYEDTDDFEMGRRAGRVDALEQLLTTLNCEN